jgi:hypothetical protein
VALVREHTALRTATVGGAGDVPSVYAHYRFASVDWIGFGYTPT